MGACISDQWVDGKEVYNITKKEFNMDTKFCRKVKEANRKSNAPGKSIHDPIASKSVEGTVGVVVY